MDNAKDSSKYTIKDSEGIGFIQIADDVVSSIAALAVLEVEGVSRLQGNITMDIAPRLGKKTLAKAVKVTYNESSVSVDVIFEAKFGYNLVEVSREVQEKVKASLFTMTGLSVSSVNVRIYGVDMESVN